jgi:cytochrome c556
MKHTLTICILLALAACTTEEPADIATAAPEPGPTIMLLMVEDITQASDIVWGIEDPQTDEEWQVFDDAAVALVEAFQAIEAGTAGPNDKAWAADEKFQAYIDKEYAALEAVRQAIADRNLDGVFDAGGDLYTPCEDCHIDFNPAVSEAEY